MTSSSTNLRSSKSLTSFSRFPQFDKLDSDRSTNVGSFIDLQDRNQSDYSQQDSFLIKSSKKLKEGVDGIDRTFLKLCRYGETTSRADKTARIITSLIKIAKAYEWMSYTSNKPGINKLNKQLGLTRKVFQFNSKWQALKQLMIEIPAARTMSDLLNILLISFEFICSVNDFILVLINIKALIVKHYMEDRIEMISNDFYFFECLIHLCLSTLEYVRMRGKIKKIKKDSINGGKIDSQMVKKHKKKFFTIIKYVCDCYTSHNNFSKKFYNSDPKKIAIVGMISSIIGATIAWDGYN